MEAEELLGGQPWALASLRISSETLSPDEIGRLSNDEAILLIRGLRPFRSRKAAIRTGVSS